MFVRSNLAISIDGKIAPANREFKPLGTKADWRRMHELRAESDVILMGASTLRTFRRPCLVTRIPGYAGRQPANAVVSSKLEGISERWPFFTRGGIHRILLVSREAPAARLRKFERTSEIIVLPRGKTAPRVLAALGARGYASPLVEGGGALMWEFVEKNLIDEYHVTLTPKLVGGSMAPTLVDGRGFSARQILSLHLRSTRRVGDELFLTYCKAAGG